jgi:hypothetical protein
MPAFRIHFETGEKINVLAKSANDARKDGERRRKELGLGNITKIKLVKGEG